MAKPAAAEVEQDDDIRGSLEAAFDKAESAEPDIPAEEHIETGEEEEVQVETPEEIPETPEGSDPAELRAEVDRQKPAEAVKDTKAPVDWSPSLREHWSKLPDEVRQKISARERDVNVLLQQTSDARHLADQFIRTVEPYRALMNAEGVQNPLQAVDGLMKVTAVLAMGAPQQKAERIAGLVKHYGVDIELLDQALAGSLPPPDPQQQALQRMFDERMAPVNDLLNRFQQAEQNQGQQLYGQAYQTIEQFGSDPKNEFFEDVRHDMADFLDMAAQRGVTMTLKEAYDRACALNPEIMQIISSRKPVSIADKRRAASSLPARSSGSTPAKGDGIRELLEQQFGDDSRI